MARRQCCSSANKSNVATPGILCTSGHDIDESESDGCVKLPREKVTVLINMDGSCSASAMQRRAEAGGVHVGNGVGSNAAAERSIFRWSPGRWRRCKDVVPLYGWGPKGRKEVIILPTRILHV